MEPHVVEFLILALGACVAGAMNAVAGGGTIITFPLLIFFGMPAIQANATSTLALLIGVGGGVYGYRSQFSGSAPLLKLFAPVSLVGGLLGAWLLTVTSEKFFSDLVPFLLLFATVLFLLSNVVSRLAGFDGVSTNHPTHRFAAMVVQFGVAIYGGYFGAGIGILMLAALGLIGLKNIHEMNAVKTTLGGLVNLVAAAYFVWAGLVIWPQAAVMTVGASLGYFGGAAVSTRIPAKWVRAIVVAIGIGLSVAFFWQRFFA